MTFIVELAPGVYLSDDTVVPVSTATTRVSQAERFEAREDAEYEVVNAARYLGRPDAKVVEVDE
jgi:hypothetical protein